MPLDGTERLVIDGTNMLYRMRTGSAEVAPPAALVGRIRAVIPAGVVIDLVFDGAGHGVYGRVAQKMTVRFSRGRPADDTILDLVSEAVLEGGGPVAGARILVVTDDWDLRTRLTAKGARTAPASWLLHRLDLPNLSSPAPGNRRPALGNSQGRGNAGAGQGATDGDDERPGWKPGRGATAKTGPARKVARHKRHPRSC
jgi:hypothetical protein